jgi:YD repeat-containing protein
MKTDTGRDLVWTYNGDMLASVAEGSNRAFEVVTDVTGQPLGFRINGQSYSFKLDRRPMVENGPVGRVIGNLAPTMGTFTWPNGKSDTFKFSVADDLTPELTMIDAGGQKNTYTWDVAGHILSDNDWKYTVGDILPNSNLPALRRTNAQGQSEGVSIATRTGVITETNLQGVVTTTKIFRNPGPYFNKVREISQTTNGVTRVLERRSYDEAGRLIRSMDESGTITTFTFDNTGKLLHQAVTVDPKVLAQLQQKAAEMLKVIAVTTDLEDKDYLEQELGFFYIHKMKNYQKALAMAEALPDPQVGYPVCTQAIFYDDSLTAEQKIVQYQKLLPLYPQCTGGLNFLIRSLQEKLAQK